MNNLNNEISESLLHKGASMVGFADLTDLPADVRDGFKYGISIAVMLDPEVVGLIGKGPSIEYEKEYHRVNNLLNQLGGHTAVMLKTSGFDALAKTQSVVVQDERVKRTKLPHKTVATKAALGWIGKCALLITENYGAAIRITSVLTNAELETGEPITESKCGKCEDCKNICPAGAVSGKLWKVGVDRDEFFQVLKCRDKIKERAIGLSFNEGTCGLCIWSCPWTQKHLKRMKVSP
jgi:epoxyqueuosine reductase QueG